MKRKRIGKKETSNVPLVAPAKVESLLRETEALIKIFATSIRTAQKNAP